MLAVLAAFFCLLFFAAAKKSRCRPAQGRRLKHEGIARMPAQEQKPNRLRSTHRIADASTQVAGMYCKRIAPGTVLTASGSLLHLHDGQRTIDAFDPNLDL